MTTKILITGAPGNVGSEVVRELRSVGADFRVAAFDLGAAREKLGDVSDIVHFDFQKPETFAAAFDGIERTFLVRPPALSNVTRDIAPAIHAAVSAGVRHIVFLSLQGVEHNRIVPHYKIEQAIRESGVAYTFLRSSFFMQNLSTTHRDEIRERDEIAVPMGTARTSFVDVRDIAAVAVRALTEAGHENHVYTLTGGQALDYHEVADKLSAALARPIAYTHPSALGFLRQQIRAGRPFGFAFVMTALYTLTRLGNAKDVTPDVETLLGRPPITFDQFAHDFRSSWQT